MELQEILKGVSRSFYLSLRLLPGKIREPLSLAFLACKAADTIADTALVPRAERLAALQEYRRLFTSAGPVAGETLRQWSAPQGGDQPQGTPAPPAPAEQQLLWHIPALHQAIDKLQTEDRNEIGALVSELTQGMIMDLKRFPCEKTEQLVALTSEAELDQYTYYVAGCVGRFWTRILKNHYRFARQWDQNQQEEIGEKFGKGLQMVNILRDLPRDLQNGRCYLPEEKLTPLGLTPADLLDPNNLARLKPYLSELLIRTRGLLSYGTTYVETLPRTALRLRTVVLLPMRLGFQTLNLLKASSDWLRPEKIIKVSRGKVYRSLLSSFLLGTSSFSFRKNALPATHL